MALFTKLLRNSSYRYRSKHICGIRSIHNDEKNVIRSKFEDVIIPQEPLWTYVFQNANKWADRTALECSVTGKTITYDQLRRKIDNFSKFLRKRLKLKPGDIVAMMLPNVPEYPIGFLGVLQAGMVVTTVNSAYTEDEMFNQFKQTSAVAVITLDAYAPSVKKVCQKISNDIHIIAVKFGDVPLDDGVINFWEACEEKCDIEDAPLRNFDDTVCLLYSSGTTGLPKGVEHSMNSFLAASYQPVTKNFKFFQDTTADHQDVVPAVLPFYHAYGIFGLMWKLHCGCKIVTVPKFIPGSYVSLIKNYKPHVLLIVPPIALFLSGSSLVKSEDLQSVRSITSGAAPLGGSDEDRLLEKCKPANPRFNQAYGLSETAVLTFSPNSGERCPGSAGKLVPNTKLKIMPVDGNDKTALGPNQPGELYAKGPQLFKGYLNNPQANENTFDNGWTKTGDIGYYTEDGSVFITDRIKDLIKVNSFPVAPAELEEILRSHEDVSDAAVIGIPDEKFGEVPRGFVVAKPGRNLDIDKVSKYVELHVAPHKKLRGGITVLDSIPKLASGKILKRDLRDRYVKQVK